LIYLGVTFVLSRLGSFIGFAFGIRMLNAGIGETILISLGLGLLMGGIFGFWLKINPWDFEWGHWH
jgi:hypothetical protein